MGAPITNSIEQRLKRIEDRQAIHDAIMRYCRGVDRGDPAMTPPSMMMR